MQTRKRLSFVSDRRMAGYLTVYGSREAGESGFRDCNADH
jgi:hypothetical protein